jgi:hypothetical protein
VTYLSPLALQTKPQGLGYRRGKLVERYLAPCAVVVHTTGFGPIRRATERKFAGWRLRWGVTEGDALQATVALYTHVMTASAHYVVGQDGTIVQVVPESHCAWHVGGNRSRAYFTNPAHCLDDRRYLWWRVRWQGMQTPRELGGGRLWDPPREQLGILSQLRAGMPIGSCNANSVGIEVVPDHRNPAGPWSAEAWDAVARLVLDVCARNDIPVRKDRVISHSDAHPLSRTTPSGKPWDPWSAQWSWDRFERSVAGLPYSADMRVDA